MFHSICVAPYDPNRLPKYMTETDTSIRSVTSIGKMQHKNAEAAPTEIQEDSSLLTTEEKESAPQDRISSLTTLDPGSSNAHPAPSEISCHQEKVSLHRNKFSEVSVSGIGAQIQMAASTASTATSFRPSAAPQESGNTSFCEPPQHFDSNLSLRDMYGDFEVSTDALHQSEYFVDEDGILCPSDVSSAGKSKQALETPPTSLHGTPTDPFTRTTPLVDPTVAKVSLPPPTVSESWAIGRGSGNEQRRPPVLYSAIGSLEDPSNQSFRNMMITGKSKKYDFPSSRLLLPANQVRKLTKSQSEHASVVQPASGQSTLSQILPKTPLKTTESLKEASDETDLIEKPSIIQKDNNKRSTSDKKVRIADQGRRKSSKKKPVEMFRLSSDAYTPRMGKKQIKYKPAEMRTPVQQMASGLGTLSRPNFRDALRRVAMILHQHITKIERRFEAASAGNDDTLFNRSRKDDFSEDRFATPTYKCTMVRVPMARPGMVFGLKCVRKKYEIPSESEIYEFAHRLFKTVQLSSECSIVCLIYVERLMEVAKVPLLASTWRPIVMCGLLLASKVWQDLSSWNIEFATVYPQYSLDSIHRLELQFLRMVKWDLYISSSLYAKYYFALRSLVEKTDFRQRYNRMVGGVDQVQASEALKIEKRSSIVKEEVILQLSRSM